MAPKLHAPAGVRLDVLLGSALALASGATATVTPLPAALALVGVLLLCFRALGRARTLLLAALFGAGVLRAELALDTFDRERFELRDALGKPRRCAFQARITSSPVKARGSMSYLAEVSRAECEELVLDSAFRARLYGGPEDLRRGDVISGVVDLAPAQLFRNFNVSDPRPRAARSGAVASGGALSVTIERRSLSIPALIDRARAHVRGRIEATYPPLAAGLGRALVLGESDLGEDDAAAFRLSGLSHLLAVSGTHLVFAVVAVVKALAFILVRIEAFAASVRVARVAAGAGIALALGYADFAGGSGSAWRAAYMLAVAFAVTAAGRRPSAVRCLAASILIGACVDPLAAFDISFLLSVAATAGLIGVGPRLQPWCERVRPRALAWLAQGMGTTLSAMLPCLPLLALLGSEVGLAGLLANVLAAPFGEMAALPLCLLHSLLAFWPELEKGAAMAGGGALLVVRGIARFSAEQSALRIALPMPSAFQLAALAISGALLLTALRARALLALVAASLTLGALELAQRAAGAPRGKLIATVLDVGQGDAALLELPDASLWLIDGGGFVGSPVDPGRAVILPELTARRRKRIDVLVLSHPHPDHFLGLESVVREVAIGEFWDTGEGLDRGAGPAYARIIALLRERRVPIRTPAELCGRRERAGVVITVLWPCPSYRREWSENDNSFVIRFELGQRAYLFTGDAEHDAEAALLAAGATLRADFLKVGHHGSRTSSTPAFLDAVRPTIATLSTGVRNRFGHPHTVTLDALGSRGIQGLRTDRSGAARIETDGKKLQVSVATAPR